MDYDSIALPLSYAGAKDGLSLGGRARSGSPSAFLAGSAVQSSSASPRRESQKNFVLRPSRLKFLKQNTVET
jgi:hypothetical protein